MKSQQMMTCNYCNGQGWLNQHEACPICQGQCYVPMMTMPAVRQQKPEKPKQQQPPARQQQPPARQQQPPARQQQPVYQQTPSVYQQPVRQQQPVYPEVIQNTGQELHIFVHSDQGQQEYQRSAIPATPTPAKGISIFQICCIGAVILAILSWGGAL